MRHEDFIVQVQARAQLPTSGEAELATKATLETLGERIPERVAEDLAEQLPYEIGMHLRRADNPIGDGPPSDRNDFLNRVAFRAETNPPRAESLARAVLEVVDEASDGVMDKVRGSLPADIRELADSGSRDEFD